MVPAKKIFRLFFNFGFYQFAPYRRELLGRKSGCSCGNRKELTWQGSVRRQRQCKNRRGGVGGYGRVERNTPGLGQRQRKYNVPKLTN